ncbi:low temperature requirement protein A [Arthrobacter sp. H35-D1]|uniref:low temperature requirement protein A n=1 Tax=Arthrobacter sp. H35-D1 TaxID=3046202 RepID=UPI0024B9A399|nr:low temperature requirement protein A [Arthrobacter sp. H35-D1]MDJ0315053.1 low temperature requirement protein A [Arthrobacter sp. H35-D1]
MRTAAQRPRPAREPGRVHWMELFFDLVFVAFIGQLAHGIHGDPGWPEFGTYVLLFFPAWWAWVNIVSVINLLPGLTSRVLGLSMVAAMAAAGLMAAAAPHAFGERAWAFSLANAAMRGLLLVLWLHEHRKLSPEQPWRIWMYNGGTSLLWFIAVFLPLHAAVILWAVAIAVEVGMIAASRWIGAQRNLGGINLEHATERLGLFVVIVLGESIFTIVSELAQDWHPGPALASALGFMIVALLGWAFFQYGMDVLASGLGQLRKREDFSGILQTTLFMPFALVLGVTSIAAAIATAIPAPNTLLPPGAAVALGGGLALFYGTNAIVSLRFGAPLRSVLPWGIPAVVAALVLVPLGGKLPAAVVLALAVALLLLLTVQAEANARRRPDPP